MPVIVSVYMVRMGENGRELKMRWMIEQELGFVMDYPVSTHTPTTNRNSLLNL